MGIRAHEVEGADSAQVGGVPHSLDVAALVGAAGVEDLDAVGQLVGVYVSALVLYGEGEDDGVVDGAAAVDIFAVAVATQG